ncbi:hypothetical protein H8790_11945 [Oscillibacter hominis]|uniref:Uncharacterized protein n=1 Tax=Oscillibacter hominis TaxID=2763056 RepID=A0A7G9B3K4_9FIRM|nr:hypothetical protein [Oscillibacter hominis]QNL44135.1 hypothetical protein H8790_11945 [Oscillibacter hominis]
MTQLILNGLYLPETSKDKYQCHPSELSVSLDMISGRRIKEIRGCVQVITYSYDYLGNDLCRQVLLVLRSGKPFPVTYLPDDSDTMQTGTFLLESLTPPTFAFSKGGTGLWHNLSFTLREVRPHD